MRRGVREGLIFLAGIGLGGGFSYLGLKKFFENKANKEVSDVREAFEKRLNEVYEEFKEERELRLKNAGILDENGYISGKNGASGDDSSKKSSKKQEKTVSEMQIRNVIEAMPKVGNVKYGSYFRGSSGEVSSDFVGDDPAAGLHPVDSDEDDGEMTVDELAGREGPEVIFGDADLVRNNKKNRPRIVPESEFGGMAGYDFKELTYYTEDGVLCDTETEDIIDNPEALIGDALTKFGFTNSSEKRIYVRNDSISCDFEVDKIFGSYSNGMNL